MTNNTILTITGSDSTGESGVQADIRTITGLGCTALSVITSVTVQNTLGIQEFFDLPAQVVGGQIEAIINDVQPQAVKIGMVRRAETVAVIVGELKRYKPQFVIYDPVLLSSRGDRLMGDDVIQQIRTQLFPLCSVIIVSRRDAKELLGNEILSNVCFTNDESYHGLANGFSSSLAAYLCKGDSMANALAKAGDFCRHQVSTVPALQGRGSQLYNDFIHLVRQYFASNSDVAFYANKLNVGSAYLGQVCRRVAGRSPKGIIDEYLAQAVGQRLVTSQDSIQEIATSLGFSSQGHLSRFFRKMEGMSPSEYRTKQNSKLNIQD